MSLNIWVYTYTQILSYSDAITHQNNNRAVHSSMKEKEGAGTGAGVSSGF